MRRAAALVLECLAAVLLALAALLMLAAIWIRGGGRDGR